MVTMRVRSLILCGRAILLGWAVLLVLAYFVQRLVLSWTFPLLGRGWLPTELVALNCLELAAAGWVIGRTHRPEWKPCLAAFALTLLFWDLNPELALNVPWLFQLAGDALRDSTYLASFGATLVTHLLLFASLAVGGFWSRPPETPVSIRETVTNAAGSPRDR